MHNHYYCLIAGLPEIHPEDNKMAFNPAEFLKELKNTLSKEDFGLIETYLWRYDNHNLLEFLRKDNPKYSPMGTWSPDEIEDIVNEIRENGINNKSEVPVYFQEFISNYQNETQIIPDLSWEDQLTTLYFREVLSVKNEFAREWYEFELRLKNTVNALIARESDMEYESKIIGSSDYSKALKKSGLKDFGLGTEEYFKEFERIADIDKIIERERQIDLLKWKFIEEKNFFNYFTVERILGYLIMLDIVKRWIDLDKETGEKMFKKMVESMKSSVEFSEEFSLNKKK